MVQKFTNYMIRVSGQLESDTANLLYNLGKGTY